jgi:hypothetical protein
MLEQFFEKKGSPKRIATASRIITYLRTKMSLGACALNLVAASSTHTVLMHSLAGQLVHHDRTAWFLSD